MLEGQNIAFFEEAIKGRELYIFGTGNAGRKTIDFCRNKGYRIDGLVDNNKLKEGTIFNGYRVYIPHYLLNKDKDNIVVLIASVYLLEIEKQLREMGIINIFSAHLCKMIGQREFPKILYEDMKKIEELKALVRDQQSIDTIDRIVQLRNNDENRLYEVFSGRQYFQKDIFDFENEIFLDCGCYRGEEIDYLRSMKCGIEKIYAFEPDKENFQVLQKKYANDPEIVLLNKGVWDKKDILHFCAKGTDGSAIAETGTDVIEAVSIDEEIADRVTFIKMDIEGAELEAIKGAENTIKRYSPKLAICIYHKPNDLWEIPMAIKKVNPQYEIYIRQHSLGLYDTVMYAVCNPAVM